MEKGKKPKKTVILRDEGLKEIEDKMTENEAKLLQLLINCKMVDLIKTANRPLRLSIGGIAKKLNLNESSIRRLLKNLEKKGFFKKQVFQVEYKQKRSYLYFKSLLFLRHWKIHIFKNKPFQPFEE